MKQKLLIGEIPYTNLFPIFYELKKGCNCRDYRFIKGIPSVMNKMLRKGEIDISPSSSIEYLREKDDYIYLEGHSISSLGHVKSIMLFSRLPIEDLDGREVFVTHQSETSPVLLKIIMKRFYSMDVTLKTTFVPIGNALMSHTAYLSIGDDALVTASRAHMLKIDIPNQEYSLCTIDHNIFYVYDLGNLWLRHTGLPFVFALWIAKRDRINEKKELFDRFKKDLDNAKSLSQKNLKDIALASKMKDIIGFDKLIGYWKGISYDLSDEHLDGLETFGAFAEELRLL
ncbi:MAG: menaquinone biosynthesis protein [Nitrospirae bacterium]|nr:menaquinone biosynthesis protein [Nitrospirota bacterium]